MIVGCCKILFALHHVASLKDKRSITSRIRSRVRERFNVSIAETGENDIWQRAELSLATVGNDRRFVNSSLDKIVDYIEKLELAEIIDYSIEILNLSRNAGCDNPPGNTATTAGSTGSRTRSSGRWACSSSPDEDPRIGFVTVVRVRVRADLRHARIHVSVLGDEAQKPRP